MGLDVKIKGVGFLTLADVDISLGPDLHVVCLFFCYYLVCCKPCKFLYTVVYQDCHTTQ